MEGIPKIKKIKNSIVNLPNINDSLKDLIKLNDFESNENESIKEFIIYNFVNLVNFQGNRIYTKLNISINHVKKIYYIYYLP